MLTSLPNYGAVSAMIMSSHLTGRNVEAAARGRASQAIRELAPMGVKTAHIVVDGQEFEVHLSQVELGDIMLVRTCA